MAGFILFGRRYYRRRRDKERLFRPPAIAFLANGSIPRAFLRSGAAVRCFAAGIGELDNEIIDGKKRNRRETERACLRLRQWTDVSFCLV